MNVKHASHPIRVTCPDGSILTSSKTGLLNLPSLPVEARKCHIFQGINGALLSIGTFCDHGMTAFFDENKLEIRDKHSDIPILTGHRDDRGMYMLPLVDSNNAVPISSALDVANSSIYSHLSTAQSCAKRVAFISSALGNPADSTLIAASKAGYLNSIPNTTSDQIRKYAPCSINSMKGHLDQSKQHIWPTRKSKSKGPLASKSKHHKANALIVKIESSNALHGDLTGHYPVTSRKGNRKVLIGYSEDGRFIKSIPMKGETADDLIQAYDKLISFFKINKRIHTVIKLDNQTSTELENYFEKVAKLKHRYVAPGNHRTLHAERDIRTWKNHFIATRAGTDPSFPKDMWDELLDQVDLTLNLLRSSGVDSKSAWDYTCGPYDYTANPIGPAGAKVLVYESPTLRKTFDNHGVEAFYLGPAWDHYRCFRVFVPSTGAFRISDTLSWHIHDPFGLLSNNSSCDSITDAIEALTITLNNHPTTTIATDQLRTALSALKSTLAGFEEPPGFAHTPQRVVVQPPTPTVSAQVRPTSTRDRKKASSPIPATNTPIINTPSSPVEHTLPLQRVPLTCQPKASLKSSRSLRSNIHHVSTDSQPTTHNAVKILRHKGSDNTPLKPLRFLVQWEGCPASQNTWEPYDHVHDCRAASLYISNHPKLWYLFESDLQSNQAFNTDSDDQVPWYRQKLLESLKQLPASTTPYTETPLTRSRASAIANAILSIQQVALYDLLAMPVTQPMQDGLANASMILFDPSCNNHHANAAGDMDDDGNELRYKRCITGPDRLHWITAAVVEFRRLLSKFNTIRFVPFSDIPSAKKSTISYYNPQCKTKMKSDGKHYRVRGTFGGNRSNYSGITASYQAAMSTVKLLLNKNISLDDSRWMTMDVADMYLHSRLPDDQFEYMALNLDEIPQEIIDEYKITDFITSGDTKVYVEVMGCLYGMKQAGYIANKEIVEHLSNNGYTQAPNTPCLFRHHTDDIEFTLITDDFGVRYGNKVAADKLLEVMSRKYTMTHDWSGIKYAGFDILNDYDPRNKRCELSMNGYMAAVLRRFKFNATHNVFSPEFFQPINYGTRESQLTKPADTTSPLSADDINVVQQIVGCLLYYARGVEATMRPAIDHISMEQTKGTQRTMEKAMRLLAYGATFPDATIVYYPSDMILKSNVDGSYNSEPNGQSRAAVFTFLGRTNDPNFINGPIECLSTLIPTVVSSAAETEYASLFIGGKSLLPLRYTCLDLDCIQPPTPIITDNMAAQGIATNNCKQRRSKSMDMRYHWIRDRVGLKDFEIIWRPGIESIADYLTKTQPVAMVLKMRPHFVKACLPTFPTSRSSSDFIPPSFTQP